MSRCNLWKGRGRLSFYSFKIFTKDREKILYFCSPFRRLARVVEEARLESVYTGNRIEGSNPSVSATLLNTAHGEKYGAPEREWFTPSINFFFASPLAIFKIAF